MVNSIKGFLKIDKYNNNTNNYYIRIKIVLFLFSLVVVVVADTKLPVSSEERSGYLIWVPSIMFVLVDGLFMLYVVCILHLHSVNRTEKDTGYFQAQV